MRITHENNTPKDIDPAWRIGIVASFYYKEEMDALVAGAKDVFREAGIPDAQVVVYEAAGSFEVPLIGAAVAEQGIADALIGLGIIVEGETHHARLLADSVAHGMMDVQTRHRIPFAFEILYVDDLTQVRERTLPGTNKGAEAARAVLHSLAQLRALQS